MTIRRIVYGLCLSLCAFAANAQAPIPFFTGQPFGIGGGFDPTGQMANFNNLIGQIDNVLGPLTGFVVNGQPLFAANPIQGISSVPGMAINGETVISATGSGNVTLGLTPVGFGNIDLFATNYADPTHTTGLLIFGNQVSFVKAQGLAACPGNGSTQNGGLYLGPGQVVSGYLQVLNYLNQPMYIPVCGGAQNG